MGKILRAVTNDGTAKISVITAPDMVERARDIHRLHPVGTAALGRTLCGASLLGEMLKEENATLTLRIQGGGPIGTILAVSDNAGNVRGYVSHPEVDLPIRERDGKLDVSGAVGKTGLLTVSRDIGLREPYSGSAALVSGEIAEDLAAFLTESDQLGSACALGVLVNPDGSVQRDNESGEVIMMPGEMQANEIPAYKPHGFPIVERINIAASDKFLGVSDVDIIADQQQAINKYGTKIQEKLLKGGSWVVLPEGVNVELNDDELKILRVDNPSQKAMIDVINVQPNVQNDQNMLEMNYNWAKSTLGITDAFQGKYDSSATSGSAKQFSANQSAGRLQSKREMKNNAYAKLYRMMFEFLLAYADEPYPMTETDTDGEQQFGHFDRMEFLKRDAAGELYWNDEFIIDVDPASNLASNRERLWDMVDVKYQAGGFGNIAEPASQYRLWTFLKETGFPYAATMQKSIKEEMDKQEAMQQGGIANDMAGNQVSNLAENVQL